jgi:SAM-dependent methyltransferase
VFGDGRGEGDGAGAHDLDGGSRAHFSDPVYYRSAYEKRSEDVEYYLAAALSHPGPVLEYGCGNGRIALPIARLGVPVTGVDQSAAMLADFRRTLRQESAQLRRRVTLRRGDMRSVRLERRFGLVLCTFNTLLHLYTRRDVERFLTRVRSHLRPRGWFVLDVSVPDPNELDRDPNRAYHSPRFRHATTGEVVRYTETFDYDPLRQTLEVAMRFEPRDHPDRAWTTPLTHRQFFPQELEALLHYNGLAVRKLHGDYAQAPPDETSSTLAYWCRLRRGFGA